MTDKELLNSLHESGRHGTLQAVSDLMAERDALKDEVARLKVLKKPKKSDEPKE